MKAYRLWTTCFLTVAALSLPTPVLAAGAEGGKFINGLTVQSGGTISVTVKSPGDSAGCPLGAMTLGNSEKDRIYGVLLAAKTANLPVSIAFDNACKITQITI